MAKTERQKETNPAARLELLTARKGRRPHHGNHADPACATAPQWGSQLWLEELLLEISLPTGCNALEQEAHSFRCRVLASSGPSTPPFPALPLPRVLL